MGDRIVFRKTARVSQYITITISRAHPIITTTIMHLGARHKALCQP
jgi:hypothetical protein